MTNNDTWAILASGPSMSKEVAESVRPFRVIAVSNTYELAPWADVLVSNDKSWWTNTPNAKNFTGEKFCGLAIEPPRDVERFSGAMSGSNSALLAMQIAVSKGAKRILLFGVDLTGKHYFGDHPAPLRNPSAQRFEIFKKQFAAYQPKGVEIFNCSKSSQLRAYPAASLEDFLPKEVVPERIESPLILQGQKGEKGDPGKAIEGPRGPQGPKGDPGPVGPMPEHEWQGTALRFEKPDGSWGETIDLKGEPGKDGQGGGGGGGAAIRDGVISTRSTWSSSKIAEEIAAGGGSGGLPSTEGALPGYALLFDGASAYWGPPPGWSEPNYWIVQPQTTINEGSISSSYYRGFSIGTKVQGDDQLYSFELSGTIGAADTFVVFDAPAPFAQPMDLRLWGGGISEEDAIVIAAPDWNPEGGSAGTGAYGYSTSSFQPSLPPNTQIHLRLVPSA